MVSVLFPLCSRFYCVPLSQQRMRMRRLFIVLSLIACATCKPQRNPYTEQSDRPGPGQLQAYVKFSPSDIRHLKTRGYALPIATASPAQIPQGFRSTIAPDTNVASTHQRRPAYEEENYPVQNAIQLQGRPQQVLRRPNGSPQQFRQQLEEESKEAILEEEKLEEEPDRLTLLLPNSKFDCSGKVTGYYADEGLNCEVFHYCQDNAKHSWICPDGFTFHQVHLICMPPSSENICAKSSQFHFVNDYLYKPINAEEVQNKPNVTLRYSDRYYPDSYYESEEEDDEIQQQIPRKQPIQVGFQKQIPQAIPVARTRQPQVQFSPTLRPETHFRGQQQQQHGQVFHSPEEVNISLQQRRPFVIPQRGFQHPQRDHEIEYQ